MDTEIALRKKNKKYNTLKIFIFIACFFSSIIGLNFFNISANLLFSLPLLLYLLFDFIRNYNKKVMLSKHTFFIVAFYFLLFFSSLSGLFFSSFYLPKIFTDVLKINVQVMIQMILVYIPILALSLNSPKKNVIACSIHRSILIIARLNVLWVILQFLLYYLFNFDLNKWLFIDILRQESNWTMFSNLTNQGILLRPTGLNHDSAFLSVILLFAISFDQSIVFRVLYISTMILSFSRSGFISVLGLLIFYAFHSIKQNHINTKKLIRRFIYIIIILLVIKLFYDNVPFLKEQISRMFQRMRTISTGEDGSARHSSYPLEAIKVMFFHVPFIYKLIGIGPRVSGIAFAVYNNLIQLSLSSNMMNSAWAIECDFATVLIGSGIIGLILYYSYWVYFLLNGDMTIKGYVVSMIIMGMMYNYCTLIFILYIFIFIEIHHKSMLKKSGI